MEEHEREAIENDPILRKLRQSRFKKAAKYLQNVSACLLNPDLLVSQAFCIFLYGSFGAITPYLPLYLKEYGLAPYQVGIILGLGPIVQCLVSPIWGILAGKWHAQKLVFMCGVLSLLVKLLLFLAVQPRKQYCLQMYVNSTSNLTYHSTLSLENTRKGNIPQWKVSSSATIKPLTTSPTTTIKSRISKDAINGLEHENFARSFEQDVKDSPLNSYSSRHLLAAETIILPSLTSTYTKKTSRWDPNINKTVIYIITNDQVEVYDIFLIFLLFVLICDFLQAPTFGLGDGSVFHRLEETFRTGTTKMHFTRTFGWIASVLVVGAIISGSKSLLCGSYQFSYYTAFYFSIGFVCMAFIHALWFEYIYDQNTETETDIWKSSILTFCNLKNLTFLITSLYISLSAGFLEPFLNWYIDDLGGSTSIVAITCAVRVIATFIFYQIGKTIVPVLGKTNVAVLSLMAYAVCFFCYWLVKNLWVILAIVAVEGAGFSLLWRSCDDFHLGRHGRKSSSNVKNLTKGILEALFWGIGPGLGAMIGGALYGWLGKNTFCVLGVTTLVVLLLLGAAFYFQSQDEEEEHPDDDDSLNDFDEFPLDRSEIEADKDETDKNEEKDESIKEKDLVFEDKG